MAEALRVGIAGLGTVGASVARVLRDKAAELTRQCGREIVVTAVSARDREPRSRRRSWRAPVVRRSGRSWRQIADIDVFVELIGGDEGPARCLREGGARGRPACRDRQQGAAGQAWRGAGRDRREEGRAAQLRGGGGRRHSGHQDDARGDGRQHASPASSASSTAPATTS